MKSLILKDLYNISGTAKSAIIVYGLVSAAISAESGASSAVFMAAMMCCTLIISTFSLDEYSKWNRYALVMPVSKRDLVASKFITSIIICGVGTVVGLLLGTVIGAVTGSLTAEADWLLALLLSAWVAWGFASIFSSSLLPFIFRFGAEKSRVMLVVVAFVYTAIVYGGYRLSGILGIVWNEKMLITGLLLVPVLALLIAFVMYRISYRIFLKKDEF